MNQQHITATPKSYLKEQLRRWSLEVPIILMLLWWIGDPMLMVYFLGFTMLSLTMMTVKLIRHPHKYTVSLTADAIEGPSGDADSTPGNKPRHRFLLHELDLTRCPQPGWRQYFVNEFHLYSKREKMPNHQPRSVVIRKDLIGRRRAQALVEQALERARALQQA